MNATLRIAVSKLPWNHQEQLIMLGEIELFASLLGRCYNQMTPEAKAGALELAHCLHRLKNNLQPKDYDESSGRYCDHHSPQSRRDVGKLAL